MDEDLFFDKNKVQQFKLIGVKTYEQKKDFSDLFSTSFV